MKGVLPAYRGKNMNGQGLFVMGAIGVILVTALLQGANIFSLLAAATSSFSTIPAVLYISPYGSQTLQLGSETDVDVNINAHVPINALGITIKYPPDLIEVVGFSKQKSFLDLWTEDTSIQEDAGEVHFSGGTTRTGGLTGTSTAITLTIEAKKPGTAVLSFEQADVYASDGSGTSLGNRTHSITFTIPSPAEAPTVTIAAPSVDSALALPNTAIAPQAPSPDFNGDGKIDLIDMSILILHMIGPYDPRYDLNMDGVVNIGDLSILFAKMQAHK